MEYIHAHGSYEVQDAFKLAKTLTTNKNIYEHNMLGTPQCTHKHERDRRNNSKHSILYTN